MQEFTNQWNYHGLSTEGGSSPLQLWTEGILRTAREGNSPLGDILTEEELFWYGVEEEDDSISVPDDEAVVVPKSDIPLNEDQLNYLHSLIPTDLNWSESVTHYVELVSVVCEMLSNS